MISGSLTTTKQASGIQFLDDMSETNALMSAILSIVHPHQFRFGMAMHKALSDRKPFQDVMKHWPSCFTAMQVINNRTVPLHRDSGGPYTALDLITVIGDYTRGMVHVENCPLDFLQSPGSVLAFSPRLMLHEVREYTGNRISFAWFVKDNLYHWARIPQIPWSHANDVLERL